MTVKRIGPEKLNFVRELAETMDDGDALPSVGIIEADYYHSSNFNSLERQNQLGEYETSDLELALLFCLLHWSSFEMSIAEYQWKLALIQRSFCTPSSLQLILLRDSGHLLALVGKQSDIAVLRVELAIGYPDIKTGKHLESRFIFGETDAVADVLPSVAVQESLRNPSRSKANVEKTVIGLTTQGCLHLFADFNHVCVLTSLPIIVVYLVFSLFLEPCIYSRID